MEEVEIKKCAAEILEAEKSLFLVDVVVKGSAGNQKVLVFVDGDEGVSIEQCGSISRQLGGKIEELELFEGKYTLEVSSPGLDFPLTKHRQYVKNIGREVVVELASGEKLDGLLKKVTEDDLEIDCKGQLTPVSFTEIKETKVKVSFK